MVNTKKQTKGKKSRGTRGRGGRRGGTRRQVHTLTYSCSFAVDKREGTRNLLHSHFGTDLTRPCRVKSLSLTYSSARSIGTTFSFTIESATSTDDATCRSPPLMLTPFSRRYVLRNPSSTDFAYINATQPVSDLTLYNSSTSTPTDVGSYFLAVLTMEFMPMQPHYKDLGVLPPGDDFGSTSSQFSIVE